MTIIIYSFLLSVCCSGKSCFDFGMEVFAMCSMRAFETPLENSEIKMTSVRPK